MKKLIVSLSLCASVSTQAKSIEETLSRPLILGASVSSGYSTSGPGTRASLRYTVKDQVLNLAVSGKSAIETLRRLPADLTRFSAIIAIDLFFLDSTLESSIPSQELMLKLIRSAKAARIPLVLGDIPELWLDHQPGRYYLNEQIRYACKPGNGCYLFSLDGFMSTWTRNGGEVIGGKFLGRRQMTSDGFHPTPVVAEYLADKLIDILHKVN